MPKATRERRTRKTQSAEEIRKIRTEINETETKKTVAKINKNKSWFLEKIKQN